MFWINDFFCPHLCLFLILRNVNSAIKLDQGLKVLIVWYSFFNPELCNKSNIFGFKRKWIINESNSPKVDIPLSDMMRLILSTWGWYCPLEADIVLLRLILSNWGCHCPSVVDIVYLRLILFTWGWFCSPVIGIVHLWLILSTWGWYC